MIGKLPPKSQLDLFRPLMATAWNLKKMMEKLKEEF